MSHADVAIMVLHCEQHGHESAIADGFARLGVAGLRAARLRLRS
ncbi:hypothetical protein SynPROSU1_02897 [Synechococcus sp. PROS-U-1]|nr:hypothetical protein SynPROSU1_02897 [Synechococcus sp. PROS-U-1]